MTQLGNTFLNRISKEVVYYFHCKQEHLTRRMLFGSGNWVNDTKPNLVNALFVRSDLCLDVMVLFLRGGGPYFISFIYFLHQKQRPRATPNRKTQFPPSLLYLLFGHGSYMGTASYFLLFILHLLCMFKILLIILSLPNLTVP